MENALAGPCEPSRAGCEEETQPCSASVTGKDHWALVPQSAAACFCPQCHGAPDGF